MTYGVKALKDAAGASFNAGVDIISSVVYNRLKMAFGDEGSITDVSATNPLPVTGSVTALIDDADPVEVRGNSTILTVIPTMTATPYSPGDLIGGEITLTNAVRSNGGGAVWQSIHLFCDDGLTPDLTLLFYDSDLVGGTYTDNVAPTLSSADKAAEIAVLRVAPADWITVAGDTRCTKTVGFVLKANSTQDLRLLIVTNASVTFSGAGVLTIKPGELRD